MKNHQVLGTVAATDGTPITIGLTCPTVPSAPTAHPNAVFAGYSHKQLEAAFEKVKSVANWKNPINKRLPHPLTEEDIAVISAAVAFYTGSEVSTYVDADGVTFTAAGYYLTIGA